MANSLDHLSNRTRLEWLSGLNTEFRPAKNFRRTSIICTIGELPDGIPYSMNIRKSIEADFAKSRSEDKLRREDQPLA